MSELLKLAERCEQATGPDRLSMERLCWEIWIAANEPEAKLEGNGSDRGWQVRLGGSPLGGGKIINFGEPPTYTASLDAAMTLVPGGYERIQQEQVRMQNGSLRCWASIDGWPVSPRRCATPALALCAAALRARAVLKGEQTA